MKQFAFFTFILMSALSSFAQETGGSIRGTVTDPSGAAIGSATVTITNLDTGVVVRSLSTQDNGSYSAPKLSIGRYSVTAEAPGFKKGTVSNIELNVTDALNITVKLDVGSASETVEVQANPLQVETETANSGTLISGTQIRELSLNNRNYEQLLTLVPGISSGASDQLFVGTTNPSGQTNTVQFSINGQRTSANNWTVDGADNVDRGANLTLLNYPSVDAIAEFKVLRNIYTAEFGRAAAGQVNVVTKSGTKDFHGGAYYFGRNDIFNANSFLNNGRVVNGVHSPLPRPPLRYHNFGYTIGGPVAIPGLYNPAEKKTFFFFSHEFRRQRVPATVSAFVPTAAERQGTFSTPVCIGVNTFAQPTGQPPCPAGQTGTQIAAINPVAQQYINAIWANIPEPNDPITHELLVARVADFKHRQELARVDHYFSQNWNVMFRFLNDTIPTEEPGGIFTNSPLPGISTTKTDSPGRSYVAKSVNSFGPSWLLESGYAFSYGAIISDPTGLDARGLSGLNVALPFPVTLNRIPAIAFPAGTLSSITGFGPYDDFNRNHNAFANLSKTLARHTFKVGASYNHYQKTENAGRGHEGSFSFDATGVAAAAPANTRFQQMWANFLVGDVQVFNQTSVDLTPDINSNQFEWYVQDDWKFRPNLTFNIGLRHSMFFQPFDKNGQLTTFDPTLYDPARAPVVSPLNGNITSALGTFDPLNGVSVNNSTSPFGSKIAPEPLWKLAPRFGFAWDPFSSGKMAIRGGYGISYDSSLVGILEQNIFANPPFAQNISFSDTRFENPAAGTPPANAVKVLRGTPFTSDIPYVQSWSLDVQRELLANTVVAVGYYGNKGTHLIGIADINQPLPGARAAAGNPNINVVRPFLGYGPINAVLPIFTSNYHGLQTSVEKRFTGVSQIGASYTWSKGLTTAQSDRSSAPQTVYNIAAEYGPAQFDRRHIFSTNFVYELPWYRSQQGVVGKILGGWQTSGIVYIYSGVPLTILTSGQDPAGIGVTLATSTASGRPDLIGNPVGAQGTHFLNGVGQPWFNPAAFALVPAGQARVGTSGRGVVYGPGFNRVDFSLFKNIAITEQVKLQFRAESFNLFNHTNPTFSNQNVTFSSGAGSTFGRVNAYRDPREMQFGLKLSF